MKMDFETLYNVISKYLNHQECEQIHKTYLFAQKAHENQIRKSGEAYIIHPLNVALILANQKMPTNVIMAGLLHDVVEDTNTTIEEIEALFGEDVASIVAGVTKLDHMPRLDTDQLKVENQRKVIIASAKDVRVIIVKLADRLHNMQTIKYMNENKQKQIAKETLEIYAPIAHRLGMYRIKWELEDLSFKILNRESYNEIVDKINMKRSMRDDFVKHVVDEIKQLLTQNNIDAIVYGRTKHIYSIYQSMKRKHKTFDEINDLFGFRIVVKTINDCYRVLGLIHNHYKPIPYSFKDYIPTPKHGVYQSIHTTVCYGNIDNGCRIEFQIRTEDMDRVAENGVAAHWMYKEDFKNKDIENNVDLQIKNFRKIVEALNDQKSQNFVESLKNDFFGNSIIIYTPKGDVVELPNGSCVLDFAFYVHTNIGLHAVSGCVNGKDVSLFYTLQMGDVVQVITSDIAEPQPEYFVRVKTHRAQEALKKYFNNIEKEEIQLQGKKELTQLGHELNMVELIKNDQNFLYQLAIEFNEYDINNFLYDIGNGDIKYNDIRKKLTNKTIDNTPLNNIIIENHEQDNYILCRKCKPLPGDNIKSSLMYNNQFIVHRCECSALQKESLNAQWCLINTNTTYPVLLNVELENAPKTLGKILTKIGDMDINISRVVFRDLPSEISQGEIVVNLHNKDELDELLKALKRYKALKAINRVLYEDN